MICKINWKYDKNLTSPWSIVFKWQLLLILFHYIILQHLENFFFKMWSFSSPSSSDSDDEHIIIRRRKIFRPRINNNFMAEYEYNERFRMNSLKLEYIVSSIGYLQVHHTNRNHALSPIQQVNFAYIFWEVVLSITLLVICMVYQKILFVV